MGIETAARVFILLVATVGVNAFCVGQNGNLNRASWGELAKRNFAYAPGMVNGGSNHRHLFHFKVD